MMYYINKIVGWVLSPLGIMFIGFGAGGLLRCLQSERCRTLGKWIVGVGLACVWILGCGITARLVGLPLEGEEIDALAVRPADAIVLLGGGMAAHRNCGRPEMQGGADRVWMAAKLWKAGKAPVMTLSGGKVEQSTVPLLVDLGVDVGALKYFPEARNTAEEAQMIAALGVKRILLVTSAWHMPRAKLLFERAGFEVTPAPTDYEMHCAAEESIQIRDFFPSADALARNSWAVKEWIGRLGYWVIRN